MTFATGDFATLDDGRRVKLLAFRPESRSWLVRTNDRWLRQLVIPEADLTAEADPGPVEEFDAIGFLHLDHDRDFGYRAVSSRAGDHWTSEWHPTPGGARREGVARETET